MHIKINAKRILSWVKTHRTELCAVGCGVFLGLITAFSGEFEGYLRNNLPGTGRVSVSSSSSVRPSRIPRRLRKLRERHAKRVPIQSSSSAPTRKRAIVLRPGPEALVVTEPAPVQAPDNFPAFGVTMYPVARVPNWGAMTKPAEWNRTYAELAREDFVAIPAYDLRILQVPMDEYLNPRNAAAITAKLFYSTRYFGAYDLDAGEFSAIHPGMDFKLALDTPIRAIAGGRVRSVSQHDIFGLHVIIEHRHPVDGTFYSVYAHLGTSAVRAGDIVEAGRSIGTVGMTGNTSGPHLHLQVDRGEPGEDHAPYAPASMPSRSEAARHGVQPIEFIAKYR
jgi:murein DD-endopeptidase MepM/ murein hydrolase activator NlpD